MSSETLLKRVEQFILDEVDLLDDWKLEEWSDLFTPDGHYMVPPLNVANADTVQPGKELFFAQDDIRMIRGRVGRMLKKTAYVESPRSNIRHMVTNFRLLEENGDTVRARATFLVYRARRGMVSQYVGRYFYTLVKDGDSFKMKEKRACLDNDLLQPQGSLGIIL
jgi:p-cumate 2,3-dioxygenase subunit beta